MNRYERVTFTQNNGKRKTCILRVTTDNDRWLCGIEVHKDGDEVSGKDFDVRKHMIMKEAVVKRQPLKWNLMYGELENA